ncbi:MAG: hypothetical protein KDA96_19095, partial [Planctomycetaceae bacterium]|nr:hypothetical protein [Planctomycetaceae bacterium]
MKRHGFLVASFLGATAAGMWLVNHHRGLDASEELRRSFREAYSDAPAQAAEPARTRLNYFDSAWDRVLRNLAEENSLTLVMDHVPPGRFSRRDRTEYTLDQSVRILNAELEPQGYRLLTQGNFLIVLNLDQARTEYSRPRLTPQSSDGVHQTNGVHQTVAMDDGQRTASPAMPGAFPRQPVALPKSSLIRPAVGQSRGFTAEALRPVVWTDESDGSAPQEQAPQEPPPKKADPVRTQIVTLQKGSAREVARSLYMAFEKRAVLQKEGVAGFPTFAVLEREPVEGEEVPPAVLFRVGIDETANKLMIEAPAARLEQLVKLVEALDRPVSITGEDAIRVVPSNGASEEDVQKLSNQLRRMSAVQENAERAAVAAGEQPASDELPSAIPRSDVVIQVVPGADAMLLQGAEKDLERVEAIIRRLEEVSTGSLADVHFQPLKNANSEAMAELLESVYEELAELRQRNGQNEKSASFLPVVQPNAILVLAPSLDLPDIQRLIARLDQPLSPDLEFQVFSLRSAIASQVLTALETFYEERGGLGTRVRAFADVRTNSIVVQARPNELAEVAKLIQGVDSETSGSVNQMQVFPLKNALAEELSQTINTAIQSVVNPPQQTQGTGGGGFGGFGGTTGSQQLRDSKSVALEFLTTDGNAQRLIRSGIMVDVRVNPDVRSNSLIVTAPEASMGLMGALITQLDRAPNAEAEIKVFTLRNADAEQTVDLLTTLFENQNQQDALGVNIAGTADSSSSLIPLQFSADIRTNTVLAVGSAESLAVVEAILLRLDTDSARQLITKVIPLQNAPAEIISTVLVDYLEQQTSLQDGSEDLISNIERMRREVLVAPDANSNTLIVTASSPEYFSQMEEIIARLDAEPPQVVISAMLVEVTLDQTDEFGIELGFQDPLLLTRGLTSTTAGGVTTLSSVGTPGLNFNNTALALGNNSSAVRPGLVGSQGLSNFSMGRQNTDLGFGGFVFSAQSDAVNVLLRALAARRTVQILSRPQVTATHNNEALINVGQNIPVVEGVSITGNGIVQPNVNRYPTGIILQVTPRVRADGVIAMDVYAEKSSVDKAAIAVYVDATTGNSVD